MIDIQKCIDRNIAVGNKQGDIDRDLEYAMLQEELTEGQVATEEKDRVEQLDAIIDTLRVGLGSLWKAGVLVNFGQYDYTGLKTLKEIVLAEGVVGTVQDILEVSEELFTTEQIIQGRDAVAESNNSKLVDGKAIRDENGKIMKGTNYKKPDFSFLN